MTTPLLSLSGVRKAYPGVVANDDVSLDIGSGEIHALLGENGAGKSTLVKMIYGLVKPDAGRMSLQGKGFTPANPRAARAAGIGMVFQHFSLFDALSVAENIALGMDKPPPMRDLTRRIRDMSETYGLPLAPDRIVGDLSAGERQRVEIIRCLLGAPKLLIMDEPTSVLTPQEVDILFRTLRTLAAEGTAILYISHKLEEIRALCDAATILRAGKVVAECTPRESSAKEMAELMVGKDLVVPERAKNESKYVVLQAKDLSVPAASQFGMSLKKLRFAVQEGEILGIGGVAGNGQDELLAVLAGEMPCSPNELYFNDLDLAGTGITERRGMGVLGAPEERLGHAAAPDMSLTENAMLTGAVRQGFAKRGMLNWRKARLFAEDIIAKFDVRTPGPGNAARSLSGGNLQKFVIGREVLQKPELLIVNQPTWGVDASAAAAIRQALMDLAADGAAVIVISQDLDELMEISDRFAVLNEGRLSAPRATEGLDIEQIGLLMGGAHGMGAPANTTEPPQDAAEEAPPKDAAPTLEPETSVATENEVAAEPTPEPIAAPEAEDTVEEAPQDKQETVQVAPTKPEPKDALPEPTPDDKSEKPKETDTEIAAPTETPKTAQPRKMPSMNLEISSHPVSPPQPQTMAPETSSVQVSTPKQAPKKAPMVINTDLGVSLPPLPNVAPGGSISISSGPLTPPAKPKEDEPK